MFEKVNPQHPDKVADRIAGAVVDLAYTKADNPKIAVEVLLGHGECTVMIEASVMIWDTEVEDIVHRIAGDAILVHTKLTSQDIHLANNQQGAVRCGDNGIFKGCAPTHEQKLLTAIAASIYDKYPHDGKYIIGNEIEAKLNVKGTRFTFGTRKVTPITICQSHATDDDLTECMREFFTAHNGGIATHGDAVEPSCGVLASLPEKYGIGNGLFHIRFNPLGEWTGGPDVDCGATNRKLGSDMGDGVTGGGLHGKDLSKADVSVNIVCHLLAVRYGEPIEACCSIGDEEVTFNGYYSLYAHERNLPKFPITMAFSDIVEQARLYILTLGGFEKFAEWGLIRAKDL